MNRMGEESINYQGLKMTIINYRTYDDIDVQFEDGSIRKNVRYAHFKSKCIKNFYYPEVFGVGCLGEASCVDSTGKQLRSYKLWSSLLNRCYNSNHKYYKNYGGKNIKVCDEWLCYANFKKWYDINYYEIKGKNVELDKDILIPNNKLYSPNACVFVPRQINTFFRGYTKETDLPKGVSLENGKYRAYLNIDGKRKTLGKYNTIKEAECVYKQAWLKEIKKLAIKYQSNIPIKLYDRLIEISEGD